MNKKTEINTNSIPPQIEILTILDDSPINFKIYKLWFIASGGTLLNGISLLVIGVVLHLMSAKVSPTLMGLIGAALVLGAVFGSNIGGKFGDVLGRKKMTIINMLIIGVGSLLSAIYFNPILLFIGQLIIGFGIGSDFAVSAAYVQEITPKKKRSELMVATITFQSVGLLLGGLFAWSVVQKVASDKAYMYLYIIMLIISLLFFLLRFTLVESPSWLMRIGQIQKAVKNTMALQPKLKDRIEEIGKNIDAKVLKAHFKKTEQKKQPKGILLSKQYLPKTILSTIPWFLLDIATYGIGLFTPIILGDIIKPTASMSTKAMEIQNILGTTGVNFFLLVGFLLALFLVPKFGKIKMQKIGFIGMFVGMAILFFALEKFTGTQKTIVLFLGFILFNLFMDMGPNATTFTMAPELFPTQLHATASGFAAGYAKVGAVLGIFVFPLIRERFGVSIVLAGVSVISLLGYFITLVYAKKVANTT